MRYVLFFGTLVVCSGLTASVLAQDITEETTVGDDRAWFGIGAEGLASIPLDESNAEQFGTGGGGAVDFEFNAHPYLGLHGGFFATTFSAGDGNESSSWVGGRGGVRFHWAAMADIMGDDGWIDAHFNYGSTGGLQSAGFDAGTGYEFGIVKGFRLGPFVRYQFVADPDDSGVQFVSLGLSLGFLGDPRRPSSSSDDLDGDGITNANDNCPATPEGASPDPDRPGCPALDADGDGVFDSQDVCPMEPKGARPDDKQLGCPVRDQDGDGIIDRDDHCPDVAQGAAADPNRPGCPTGDRDGDGITDAQDQCPNRHAGPNPDPAKAGCPAPDRDNDSVPDIADKCPDEAGSPSDDPEKNGCPGLVRVAAGKIEILEPIYFRTGSDEIKPTSKPVLSAVKVSITRLGIKRLRIEGHTDSTGGENYNEDLSRRRAQSVLRWLINSGVDPSGLEAVGFGENRPIADNDSRAGRAKNRRVEFHILDAAFKSNE